MNDIQSDPIGASVRRVAAREFWYNGVQSNPCCTIFIEDHDQRCWELYYNDEHQEWRLAHSDLGFPEIGSEFGDTEMKWLNVDLAGGAALKDKEIIDFRESFDARGAYGRILFDGLVTLRVTYSFSDEVYSFLVESGS